MRLSLVLAFLFFIGSCFGWVLELLYRNLTHRHKKWINPGFCTGPYLPIYGFGLCTLFLLASLEDLHLIADPVWNRVALFLAMAVAMTLIEYIAGLACLKYLKVRLWDYSNLWGNIQGIICPLFSFFIGMFFGVFIIDVVHSSQIIVKLKKFAEENKVVVKYESIKDHIRDFNQNAAAKYHFFSPFRSDSPLAEHLKEMYLKLEKQRDSRK